MELLVGLLVLDDAGYAAYRAAMAPILMRYDGGFRYDFRVAEVLASATPEPINRVFTIGFPSEAQLEGFFADPEYLAVKEQHFAGSVGATTILARYPRP
ncbi:MAG: DUF1330 domain-containing protein [Planctomycetota bacterium]